MLQSSAAQVKGRGMAKHNSRSSHYCSNMMISMIMGNYLSFMPSDFCKLLRHGRTAGRLCAYAILIFHRAWNFSLGLTSATMYHLGSLTEACMFTGFIQRPFGQSPH